MILNYNDNPKYAQNGKEEALRVPTAHHNHL
jgi:hypothetical protein